MGESAQNDKHDAYSIAATLFMSALGFTFLIAFHSLSCQVLGLSGSEGISPALNYLNHYGNQFGSFAWLMRPSIFWLNSSDGALLSMTIAGCIASILLIAGISRKLSLLFCWLTYLSYKNAMPYFLGFQWDDMLLECGLLAFFLPQSTPLFEIFSNKKIAPNVQPLLLLRWMLFRVMFFSGLAKLLYKNSSWLKMTALPAYYETQLLPNRLSWYLHTLPNWFHLACIILTLTIEIVVPLFLFAPSRLRTTATIIIAVLQIVMFVSGNHGFVNLLTLALCLTAIDDGVMSKILPTFAPLSKSAAAAADTTGLTQSTVIDRDKSKRGSTEVKNLFAWMFVCLTLLVSLDHYFPGFILTELSQPTLDFLVDSYHLTGNYGLYPQVFSERTEIILEGSNDGIAWAPYQFKYHIGDLMTAPPTVAPYQPRLDWRMRFAALSTFQKESWFNSFCQQILRGSPTVLSLLKSNPFHNQPPKFLRADLYRYRFTTPEEKKGGNAWWHRDFVAHYMEPTNVRIKEIGVRALAFDGTWYQKSPQALLQQLNDLRAQASVPRLVAFGKMYEKQTFEQIKNGNDKLVAIVAPHAGYRYSALTAMRAYLTAKIELSKQKSGAVKRIFLIGPLHGMYKLQSKGALLSSENAFATPFGALKLDQETIQGLAQKSAFSINDEAHNKEHSLEMQLPLIHYTFGKVELVPILLASSASREDLQIIGREIKSILREDDLIIISADMTHWGARYHFEPFKDNVRSNVQALDEKAYSYLAKNDEKRFWDFEEKTQDSFCGFRPMTLLLDILGNTASSHVIDYSTSQDLLQEPKDESSKFCVGYLSLELHTKKTPK